MSSSESELTQDDAKALVLRVATESHLRYLFEEERPNTISVSLLTPDCMRKSYYEIKTPIKYFNFESLNRIIRGKLLHTIKMTKAHELSLIWQGITAHIDEYFEEGILIDKKTTSSIPTNFAWPYHTRQLEYYRVHLEDGNEFTIKDGEIVFGEKSNRIVKHAFILYYDVDEKNTGEWIRPIVIPAKLRPKEIVINEMLFKKEILQKSLLKNIAPPRNYPCWDCNVCIYASQCFLEESNKQLFDEIFKKYGVQYG